MSFIGQGETDRENAAVGPDERDLEADVEDGLGQDALDVLLADADRRLKAYKAKKELERMLREDIADCDESARQAEIRMWEDVASMRRWKEIMVMKEQRLAELLKEKQ